MIIKDILQSNIFDLYVKKYSTQDRVCKSIYILNDNIDTFISNLFKFNTIPSIEKLTQMKAQTFSELFEQISFIANSITSCSKQLKEEYQVETEKYKKTYNRFENIFNGIQEKVTNLLDYSCIYINTKKSNQSDNSTCSTIGKFLILPFFKRNASLYNSTVTITSSSSDNMIFSNTSDIESIPLNKFISSKISSSNDTFSYNLLIATEDISNANMLYLKITNDIKTVTIKLKYNAEVLKTVQYNSNEILTNFNPITINGIEIVVTCNNLNKGKPSSMQIEDIQIFSNVIFQKTGTFESVSLDAGNMIKSSDYMTMTVNNYGDADNTSIKGMLSISSDKDYPSFNTIRDNDYIDISLYKFGNISDIYYSKEASGTDNSEIMTIHDKKFIVSQYDNTDSKWTANIKNAKVLYGCNKYYIETNGEITSKKRFENWTLEGNYYVTYLLNYEEDIYLNIGTRTCLINNKEVTGIISIPKGISKIKVHVKDINFHLDNSTFMLDKDNIIGDSLYPYNFMWLFSGLPEYNAEGGITKVVRGPYSKSECSIPIALREPFIPFSEIVTDDLNRTYRLSITKTSDIEGTYTILPYSGIIKIVPYESSNYVTISYNKAQYNYRPCGIIFKKLLTYTTFETVIAQDNSELFSVDGDSETRILILPTEQSDDEHRVSYSQLLFNKIDDDIYISTRVELDTLNKYLTPIVGDIYVQTR